MRWDINVTELRLQVIVTLEEEVAAFLRKIWVF